MAVFVTSKGLPNLGNLLDVVELTSRSTFLEWLVSRNLPSSSPTPSNLLMSSNSASFHEASASEIWNLLNEGASAVLVKRHDEDPANVTDKNTKIGHPGSLSNTWVDAANADAPVMMDYHISPIIKGTVIESFGSRSYNGMKQNYFSREITGFTDAGKVLVKTVEGLANRAQLTPVSYESEYSIVGVIAGGQNVHYFSCRESNPDYANLGSSVLDAIAIVQMQAFSINEVIPKWLDEVESAHAALPGAVVSAGNLIVSKSTRASRLIDKVNTVTEGSNYLTDCSTSFIIPKQGSDYNSQLGSVPTNSASIGAFEYNTSDRNIRRLVEGGAFIQKWPGDNAGLGELFIKRGVDNTSVAGSWLFVHVPKRLTVNRLVSANMNTAEAGLYGGCQLSLVYTANSGTNNNQPALAASRNDTVMGENNTFVIGPNSYDSSSYTTQLSPDHPYDPEDLSTLDNVTEPTEESSIRNNVGASLGPLKAMVRPGYGCMDYESVKAVALTEWSRIL